MRDEPGGSDVIARDAFKPGGDGTSDAHSRRWFLAAGGAVLMGAGGGVGAAFLRRPPRPVPKPPPQALVDAYVAEQQLLASVRATRHATPTLTSRLDQLRRDHEAHLAAVRAALARYDRPSRAARRRASAADKTVATTGAALGSAEQQASVRAASRAVQLAGTHAALAPLFASIAACEATHAQLLR